MPDRPLLILPNSGKSRDRQKLSGFRPKNIHCPSRDRQSERIFPKFQQLQKALDKRRIKLQLENLNIEPELVVVLEIIDNVTDFYRSVQQVQGMEWLGENELEQISANEEFFELTDDGEPNLAKPLDSRIYMVFANQEALTQLKSLWDRWNSNSPLPHGHKKWESVFEKLKTIRLWGVQDRLGNTGILEDWKERIQNEGEELVPCEIELWYRRNGDQRKAAQIEIYEEVEKLEGQILSEAVIPEIAYHALSVSLPASKIKPILDSLDANIHLIRCEAVQYIQACGQMFVSLPTDESDEDQEDVSENLPSRFPVIALFDGLPLQSHRRLQGRLIVDDPDNFEENYPANTRKHGTAMASLIVNGDLSSDNGALSKYLYVRPILKYDSRDWNNNTETVPEDILIVDLVHRAVRRLFDGENDVAPVASRVEIINLSIGIVSRPFERTLSPLARLLDWLAWRYKVLFVVSAGNCSESLDTSSFQQTNQLFGNRQKRIILTVDANSHHRRLLSPAEAVNVLTVASIHGDESTEQPQPGWEDPYVDLSLPSPINRQGMGYRRGIKPDVLAEGGRIAMRPKVSPSSTFDIYRQIGAPGQKVASPGVQSGDLGGVSFIRGTSGAAAMISRMGCLLYDVIEQLCAGNKGKTLNIIPRSILLKALITHSADWGNAGNILKSILSDSRNHQRVKERMTRLLGYGKVDLNRVQECNPQRVTAISGGILTKDKSHIINFPLPKSLVGNRYRLRIIITLAWFSPINPNHQAWRRAGLWFELTDENLLHLQRCQGDH